MFFTGNTFYGRNVTVIKNGKFEVNGGEKAKVKKYDELKTQEACDIKKVSVKSTFVQVKVSTSKSSKVEAHLYGEANLDKELKLVLQKKLNEIEIVLQYEGNCYGSDLKLDIAIPKTLKTINIKTVSAGIEIDETVSLEDIKVDSTSGKVGSYANFKKANISTISGKIKLNIFAKEDISLKASTISGKIVVNFGNIKNINLSASTMTGKVINCHETNIHGYNANVNISTVSGRITIS